jgi:hypothetical protein
MRYIFFSQYNSLENVWFEAAHKKYVYIYIYIYIYKHFYGLDIEGKHISNNNVVLQFLNDSETEIISKFDLITHEGL